MGSVDSSLMILQLINSLVWFIQAIIAIGRALINGLIGWGKIIFDGADCKLETFDLSEDNDDDFQTIILLYVLFSPMFLVYGLYKLIKRK